jgi:hypothetical protein
MTILFRTTSGLTAGQLVHTWAPELAGPGEDSRDCEQNLSHLLFEDIFRGRLDDAGALDHGHRSGLWLIGRDCEAVSIEGDKLINLVGQLELGSNSIPFISHFIFVKKEAVLDFACRHGLPPPSWWAEAAAPAGEAASPDPGSTIHPQNPTPARSPRRRGRRPIEVERVKAAIQADIHEGRHTLAALQSMPQKTLAGTYGVSRETARNALKAVVSELGEN